MNGGFSQSARVLRGVFGGPRKPVKTKTEPTTAELVQDAVRAIEHARVLEASDCQFWVAELEAAAAQYALVDRLESVLGCDVDLLRRALG